MNLSDEVVLVESRLPSSVVQQCLEGTGRLVVFRGHGGQGVCVCSTLLFPIAHCSDLINKR